MMIRTAQLLIVMMVIFGLISCGTRSKETSPEQSTFKEDFSIGLIIESHKDLLIEGSLALSGMEAGPREPFVQSHETMTIQVDSRNATTLFESIRSDVVETLSNSGATIVGSGGMDAQADPSAYFSYDYSEGPFYGVINIWGLQGEDTNFVIISQITESKVPNQ